MCLHNSIHTALKFQELLQKFTWENWSHSPSPYKPDSAPNLGSKHLSGTRVSSETDVETVAENWLNGQDVMSAKHGEASGSCVQINDSVGLVMMWKSDRQVGLLIPFCIFCLLLINNFLLFINNKQI
ncbi:hypothetical protein AVEN_14710-1 [Araneus ventricosus]|uniref:Uncharacterized protein n=1 Tax=Araneus ventricosus TaxID=182803 RepID=A0A4Y2UXG3_ARAVE|nr:hypothetical protein AVEN_216900-1 [Araneus ventricosus]GBO16318.1 hypothetical protein AVEN_14710-1 [Araneus ventricosus]